MERGTVVVKLKYVREKEIEGRWPVQPGDVYFAGPHVLACGDLERGQGVALLQKYGPAAMTYCDPPYNVGIAKMFRTQAQAPAEVTWDTFLARLMETVRRTQGDVFLEMGVTRVGDLEAAVRRSTGRVLDYWAITYDGKKPSRLLHATWGVHQFHGALTGEDDMNTPGFAIEGATVAGETVFDPCLGRGLTAMHAHQLGRRCVGMELCPRRLACVLEWFSRQGVAVEQRGEL